MSRAEKRRYPQIDLAPGASRIVRKVFRIPAQPEVRGIQIVPHPSELGQRVCVADAIELVRVV